MRLLSRDNLGISFRVTKACTQSGARVGELVTPHGIVLTPAFMPVGSQGTVKTLTPQDLRELGVSLVLGNAYHLYLRPGIEVIKKMGGLHRFMAWDGPMLTDSGGYQVFSLAPLRRVKEEGVFFRSHIDGSEHFFSPERSMEIQEALGADIIMALDECPPFGKSQDEVREATERTHRWAGRCLKSHNGEQALFGIVQGGVFPALRRSSASFLASLDLPGYALGGLSLGEDKELMHSIIKEATALLPESKTRYLMGVGSPEDILRAVEEGVDLFDSALPTRVARNGAIFTRQGRRNIRNASFIWQQEPVESGCDCYACRHFSAAYLHHLFKSEELLAYRLSTLHNLRFIMRLMQEIREAILRGDFPAFKAGFLAEYGTQGRNTAY